MFVVTTFCKSADDASACIESRSQLENSPWDRRRDPEMRHSKLTMLGAFCADKCARTRISMILLSTQTQQFEQLQMTRTKVESQHQLRVYWHNHIQLWRTITSATKTWLNSAGPVEPEIFWKVEVNNLMPAVTRPSEDQSFFRCQGKAQPSDSRNHHCPFDARGEAKLVRKSPAEENAPTRAEFGRRLLIEAIDLHPMEKGVQIFVNATSVSCTPSQHCRDFESPPLVNIRKIRYPKNPGGWQMVFTTGLFLLKFEDIFHSKWNYSSSFHSVYSLVCMDYRGGMLTKLYVLVQLYDAIKRAIVSDNWHFSHFWTRSCRTGTVTRFCFTPWLCKSVYIQMSTTIDTGSECSNSRKNFPKYRNPGDGNLPFTLL